MSMRRVDYLICRIGQLRHKGASSSWARILAKLEWGEHPAAQAYTRAAPVMIGGQTIVAAAVTEVRAGRPRRRPGA